MMSKQGFKLLFIVFLIIFVTNGTNVKAMKTGFSTEELSEEEKTTFISNTHLQVLKKEPEKRGIQCFDVSEEGLVAVGHNSSREEDKEVCVYTSQGEFVYGYAFACGQSFAVEWDHENLNIYFIRSEVIISVDPKGGILDIRIVSSTIDNSIYLNDLEYVRRTIGDMTYRVRCDMGILNIFTIYYSQIVIIDAAGIEHVIYDVNTMILIKTIAVFVLIQAFITIAIVVLVRQFRKTKRGN